MRRDILYQFPQEEHGVSRLLVLSGVAENSLKIYSGSKYGICFQLTSKDDMK